MPDGQPPFRPPQLPTCYAITLRTLEMSPAQTGCTMVVLYVVVVCTDYTTTPRIEVDVV